MFDRHFKVWPRRLGHHLSIPETSLTANLEITARRFPSRDAIVFYGRAMTYARLQQEVEWLAGFLQRRLGVTRGERVLLYMQNSPQFVIAYYAILRADAVVVPINPMNRVAEMHHFIADTAARVILLGQELLAVIQPLLGAGGLTQAVVANYADYADPGFDLAVPEVAKAATRTDLAGPGVIPWHEALAAAALAAPASAGPDDWAVIPYSSGTTGRQKGCIHTHRSVMATLVGSLAWSPITPDANHLVSLPLFHVTGMQTGMNAPIYAGGTMMIMTRWDRRTAAAMIERYRIARWRSIPTMAIDLVNEPDIRSFDLASLEAIGGGGAGMPEAVAARLHELTGLEYIEGYGLTETMAGTHVNPHERPKRQCLGIPIFDVDSRVVSLDNGEELGANQPGEILIAGPMVFQGYLNNPAATEAASVEIDGKRFLRTGDIGYYDDEGYFFLVDRVKRMINASGFKVWPAEVEMLLHAHPAVGEVCVVSSPDPRRGETVKAFIVPRPDHAEEASEPAIVDWCRSRMAAYKCPTKVEIRTSLPRTATGKLQWRALQDQEWGRNVASTARR